MLGQSTAHREKTHDQQNRRYQEQANLEKVKSWSGIPATRARKCQVMLPAHWRDSSVLSRIGSGRTDRVFSSHLYNSSINGPEPNAQGAIPS